MTNIVDQLRNHPKKYYETELGVLLCGDCLEIMKDIPEKSIDLVLTDPPYGIGADKGTDGFGVTREKKYPDSWDIRLNKYYFDTILYIGKLVIIFGGNYLTDMLPVNGHWIVWDKVGEMKFENPFSDCELAWTNVNKKTVKKYVVIQQGFVAKEKERFHPTQKPACLFSNIMVDYSKDNDIILDCFLGSGTTAIACEKLNRRWIGIEISEKYCEIDKKRIKAEADQIKMF